MLNSYFRLILKYRGWVLLLCLLLSVLSLLSLNQAVIGTSLAKLFLGESPAYRAYLKRADLFGNDEVLLIGFGAEDLLEPKLLKRLEGIVERIEEEEAVSRVDSLLNLQHLQQRGGSLSVRSYPEEALESPTRKPELLAEMREDPLGGGLLISQDGQSAALIIELISNSERPAEEGRRLVKVILQYFEEGGFKAEEIHRSGIVGLISEVIEQTDYSLQRIFPFVALLLLLTVWLLFRRLWPAAVSLGIALLGVLWTLGFMVLLDRQISVLAAMVPAVVLIVSFSDVVHLCSAYLLELKEGVEKEVAILTAAEDVGRACFFTSLTTFVGFMSMSLIPTPAFRLLGLSLGFGVGVALLLAMTLVPILFSMPRPRPLRMGAGPQAQDLLDRLLEGMRRLAMERPRAVLFAFGLLSIASLLGISRLNIETDFAERLSEENRVRQDQEWFEAQFSGSNFLDLYIEAPESGGLLEPERFEQIARFQEAVKELPGVDQAFSVVDLIQRIYREMMGPEAEARFPKTRQGLAQLLLLFEMAGGQELGRLIDFDQRLMRINLRLGESGVRESHAVGLEAAALAKKIVLRPSQIEPTGHLFLLGGWLGDIIKGQRDGLLLSLLLISLMMIIAVRSLRNGLWSMLPNLLPLLVLGGYVGGFWEQVDSDTLMIAILAIGVGVDDTIHFLLRYHRERARSPDPAAALRRSFHFAGRAILMTTVILVLGFLPFLSSDYFSTWIMGSLLPLCLIVALLADLLLLPALVRLGLMT